MAKPVGKVRFSQAIETCLQQFLASLPDSEFKIDIESRLSAAYRPTRTFSEAFGEVLSYLFSNYGLILVDPQDEALKRLSEPIFEKILLNGNRYQSIIQSRSSNWCGHTMLRSRSRRNRRVCFEDEAALIRDGGSSDQGTARLPETLWEVRRSHPGSSAECSVPPAHAGFAASNSVTSRDPRRLSACTRRKAPIVFRDSAFSR
jgi:hypothetical protein